MFLASLDGLRPIASVLLFVVEKTTDTELFNGCAVPAGPVTDAARFVSENTILPVARSVADRWVGELFIVTRFADGPWVVTVLEKSSTTSSKDETVGAVELLGTAIHTLPITIAVGHIGHDFTLSLTSVWLRLLLCHPRGDSHG